MRGSRQRHENTYHIFALCQAGPRPSESVRAGHLTNRVEDHKMNETPLPTIAQLRKDAKALKEMERLPDFQREAILRNLVRDAAGTLALELLAEEDVSL